MSIEKELNAVKKSENFVSDMHDSKEITMNSLPGYNRTEHNMQVDDAEVEEQYEEEANETPDREANESNTELEVDNLRRQIQTIEQYIDSSSEEDRENGGALQLAGEKVSSETITFMSTHARGL